MINIEQLKHSLSFQRYIFSLANEVITEGKQVSELAGASGDYKSKVLPRKQLPAFDIRSAVILHPEWPDNNQLVLAGALRGFSSLVFADVDKAAFKSPAKSTVALSRPYAHCQADHQSVVAYDFWPEGRKLNCLFTCYTADLRDFATDYYVARLIQTFVSEIFSFTVGDLRYQGGIHAHKADTQYFNKLHQDNTLQDFYRYRAWQWAADNVLDELLVRFESETWGSQTFAERFEALSFLAQSEAHHLEKGRE